MTDRELLTMVKDEVIPACLKQLELKNNDYTAGKKETDGLANFHIIGDLSGQGPMHTWLTYYLKHTMAIITFVKNNHVASEPIEGRIVDSINYLGLLWALVKEEREKATVEHKN